MKLLIRTMILLCVSVWATVVLVRPAAGSDPLEVGPQPAAVRILPALSVTKTCGAVSTPEGSGPGCVIENTGETALERILVEDDDLGRLGEISSLAPGESATLLAAR